MCIISSLVQGLISKGTPQGKGDLEVFPKNWGLSGAFTVLTLL